MRAALALLVMFIAGCAAPSVRYDEQARALGWEREIVAGNGFRHVVYRHSRLSGRGPVHVYLDGDGRPFRTPALPSTDPTSRERLVLDLMRQDPAPAIYLGRPCYLGLHPDPGCSPALWTNARYSDAVVDSMTAALRELRARTGFDEVVLIGYSGGGTLAMLLAERLPQVRGVVTLAANLDIEQWTRLQGYTPLTGSLNPAAQPPLPASIPQWHYAGAEDVNVPPWLISAAAAAQPQARVRVLNGQDHRCCWSRVWPEILAALP